MIQNNFHQKITLILSLLILNNYFFLSLNFSLFLIKINFLIFLTTIFVFYFKKISENFFLKVFFILIIFISLGTPLFEWDPRSIWLFHAKRIFYDGTIFSVSDNYASFSNNAYPNLVPAFASSLAVMFGYWNEVLPKIAFLFMFLPPLILAYTFFNGSRYLIFLSIVFFTIGKYLFNGWADGLIAVYFGLSALLTYLLINDKNNFYKLNPLFYYITFCFFISLTLIKDEGSALLFILFITAFFVKIFKQELNKDFFRLFFLLFSFLPIILWKIFCYSKGIDDNHINTESSFNLMSRIYELNNYKLISYFLLLNEKFLICLIFFLISFWINWDKELFVFTSIVMIMYIGILFFVFLSTSYDFYFQLNSTAARVVKTLSFSLAFFGLYNLKDRIKNI